MRVFLSAHIKDTLKIFSFTALSLQPNDALIYNLRAEVRGKIGLIEEAMADYNKALDLQEHALVV